MFRINIDLGELIGIAILVIVLLVLGFWIAVGYIQAGFEWIKSKFGRGDKNEQTKTEEDSN